MKHLSQITLLVLFTLNVAQAKSAFRFYCQTTSPLHDYLMVSTHVEAAITIDESRATLHGYDFSYKFYEGDDNVWSEADIEHEEDVSNNPNYRPRVYKNHFQFDLSNGIFGKVTFLVPFNAGKVENDEDHFRAVLIFTNIEDHDGGSVAVECSID